MLLLILPCLGGWVRVVVVVVLVEKEWLKARRGPLSFERVSPDGLWLWL
jgi:hypothetical protein